MSPLQWAARVLVECCPTLRSRNLRLCIELRLRYLRRIEQVRPVEEQGRLRG